MTDPETTTTITDPQGNPYPRDLPLVPLREAVVFPKLVVPLGVGREKSVAAINAAMAEEKHYVILAAQRDAEVDDVSPEQIYGVGTVAEIVRLLRIPDGSAQIIVQGLQRVRITGYQPEQRFFRATFEPLTEDLGNAVEREALVRSVRALFEKYVDNGGSILPEVAMTAKNTEDPSHFADLVASSPDLTLEQRQQLLETRPLVERLKFLSVFLAKQNEILELKAKIQSEVQQTLDKTQREYILREQMKAIQKELGEDEGGAELRELKEKIEQAGMPDAVKEKALKEVGRLEKIPQASPETGVIRTYVDWLVSLPWNKAASDDWDIAQAAKILDEDHYGLPKVKDRIIEYMAVRKLSQNLRAPILCFVGPPGVGKTSLGKSIARAMGRKFIRMSLGGIRDEAEIRGHRRTYVGALPGRILQNMKTAGEVNPVFMLDEIDKVGADFRGDPSSALLEVLDPEQNNSFSDHYLEVPYDLSKVIFITTANVEDTIMDQGSKNEEFVLTGQIQKVMEESAIAALSYVRAHYAELGVPKGFFKDHAMHIHVPAGAIPKDGPSAGVTMATAIVSALTGRKVRKDVAMTGEITLRGLVLPIGGVKEKLLAAHRAGIKTFLMPKKNKKDLVDVPQEVIDTVDIKFMETIDEVLKAALLPGPNVTPAQIEAARPSITPSAPAH